MRLVSLFILSAASLSLAVPVSENSNCDLAAELHRQLFRVLSEIKSMGEQIVQPAAMNHAGASSYKEPVPKSAFLHAASQSGSKADSSPLIALEEQVIAQSEIKDPFTTPELNFDSMFKPDEEEAGQPDVQKKFQSSASTSDSNSSNDSLPSMSSRSVSVQDDAPAYVNDLV